MYLVCNNERKYRVWQQCSLRCSVVVIFGLVAAQALAQFVEEQKLVASDAAKLDYFGESVSIHGNTAVMGGYGDDCAAGDFCGAAYVFRFDGTSWAQQQKVTASDAGDRDFFGESISVSENTFMVGARNDSVYVFRFNGTSWVETQKLTASDPSGSRGFGHVVSINGDTAVVGALWGDCAAGDACGSAYIYRFDGTSWIEVQKLTASDAGFNHRFGISVSVSADTIAVGASNNNAAYVYRFNGTSWVEEQKLTASDTTSGDGFGFSISSSGDVVVVGAAGDDCADGISCGSAYVFRFNGTSWEQEQKIAASDASEIATFGISVSVSDNTVVLGAYQDADCAAGSLCGAAYVYHFDGTSWVDEQKLTASDASLEKKFGNSVSVYGDTVMVAAYLDVCAAGFACGAAYIFNGSTSPSSASSPSVATAPHNQTKDRYLSFNPSTNPGKVTALRVTRVGSTTSGYVSCTLERAGVDGKFGALVQAPEFCEWTDLTIHIRGCEIVPGNEYLVEATADGVVFSSPVSIFTTTPQFSASRQFGDLVGAFDSGVWTAPDGIVTTTDIVAVVQKFQLLDSAPHLSRMDNDGRTPNGIVAGNDILREVIAFAGGDFGFGVSGCLSGTCVPSCP